MSAKVRTLPKSILVANRGFKNRKTGLVKSWVRRYAYDGGFEQWEENGKYALRKMAAGLTVFANPRDFSKKDLGLLSGLVAGRPFAEHLRNYQVKVLDYLKTIRVFETVGTDVGSKAEKVAPDGNHGGDYDFLLKEITPILYLFKDRPDILTRQMVWLLLSQGRGESQDIPYTGNALDYRCAYMKDYKSIPVMNLKGKYPETENHLLMIYGWKFLINNYVKWMASLPKSHKRFDSRIVNLHRNKPSHYTNLPRVTDFILQMLGRTVHNGLFETNAKAYESFSVSAIMNFYSFSDKIFPNSHTCKRIKTAAQNALDTLSANFAFQSFEGKRMAPMRRNWDYHRSVGYYTNDYMPSILGILTGAYAFSDYTGSDVYPRTDGYKGKPNYPYFFANLGQAAGFALWSGLLDYRVPDAVHDFMLDKHSGYWARLQSRYTEDHYGMDIQAAPKPLKPCNPKQQLPRYFSNKAPFMQGNFEPVSQLYFATSDYLNSAGGQFVPYYRYIRKLFNTGWFTSAVKTYNAQSRPTTIVTKGDIGYWHRDIQKMEKHAITMRGHREYFWESDNLSAYKNFCCGYETEGKKAMHLDWPQRYPAGWERFVKQQFSIQRASFKIFDFTRAASHPLYGYFLVLARVSKSAHKKEFRKFARGWWEIVPGQMFASSGALKQQILQTNPAKHFTNHRKNHYLYVLAATGEKVQIHNKLGTAEAKNGIMKIWDARGGLIPLDAYAVNRANPAKLRKVPLMSVWQVDRAYQFTGRMYAKTKKSGRLEINNPHFRSSSAQSLIIDSSDYSNPKSNDPLRSCP